MNHFKYRLKKTNYLWLCAAESKVAQCTCNLLLVFTPVSPHEEKCSTLHGPALRLHTKHKLNLSFIHNADLSITKTSILSPLSTFLKTLKKKERKLLMIRVWTITCCTFCHSYKLVFPAHYQSYHFTPKNLLCRYYLPSKLIYLVNHSESWW